MEDVEFKIQCLWVSKRHHDGKVAYNLKMYTDSFDTYQSAKDFMLLECNNIIFDKNRFFQIIVVNKAIF